MQFQNQQNSDSAVLGYRLPFLKREASIAAPAAIVVIAVLPWCVGAFSIARWAFGT